MIEDRDIFIGCGNRYGYGGLYSLIVKKVENENFYYDSFVENQRSKTMKKANLSDLVFEIEHGYLKKCGKAMSDCIWDTI